MRRPSLLFVIAPALRFLFVALSLSVFPLAITVSAQASPAGTATLGGTVMADPTEKPIANAEISLTKLGLSARSDSAGNFVIGGVPAGRYEVLFKMLGYEPITTTLMFAAGQKVEGDFLLKPLTTTLAKVDVNATASLAGSSPAMIEFEARRKRGGGRYITQDVFEKAQNRLMSDVLLSKLPNLHANAMGASGRAMASGRSTVSMSTAIDTSARLNKFDRAQGVKEDCYLQVLVNGIIMYQTVNGRPLFDINTIDASVVSGIEYYTTAQTPPQYQSVGSHCGSLLIWTRAR